MVLTGGIDRDELEKLWGHGYANSKRLQFDQHGLAALSRYIGKSCVDSEEERVTYRSYNGSKNLIDPEPEYNDSKIRSRKRAQELADMDWNLWHELLSGLRGGRSLFLHLRGLRWNLHICTASPDRLQKNSAEKSSQALTPKSTAKSPVKNPFKFPFKNPFANLRGRPGENSNRKGEKT